MNKTKRIDSKKRTIDPRIDKFKAEWRKQSLFSTTFWLLLTICLTVVIYVLFQLHDSPLRNLIYSFLVAGVIIYWFTSIPFLGTLTIITLRTKSRNFFNQLSTNFGLLIIVTLVALTNFVKIEENIFTVLYIGFLLIIIVLEVIFLRLVVQGARNNKKPIFLWTFFQDSFEAYSSSFLSQQALLIDEEKNGHSQRPFFVPFSEITHYCNSFSDFKFAMKDYIEFLAEKSELISYDITDKSVKLYPRVLIGYQNYGLGIRYMWEIFLKVIQKKKLTSVTIDFIEKEISLKVKKEDYNLLNDVTYHLLGQLVIERFKKSIQAFLENNQEKAYSILFPLTKNT